MRVISRSVMSALRVTLSMGVIGLLSAPLLQAQVAPANFHRFSSLLKSDEELLRTIEHGVVFSPMHAWRGRLTDGEMQDVVAYIRLLAQQ